MIQFLLMQIKLGKITIEQVPEKYKADVEVLINEESV
jgi:hypothetical protein